MAPCGGFAVLRHRPRSNIDATKYLDPNKYSSLRYDEKRIGINRLHRRFLDTHNALLQRCALGIPLIYQSSLRTNLPRSISHGHGHVKKAGRGSLKFSNQVQPFVLLPIACYIKLDHPNEYELDGLLFKGSPAKTQIQGPLFKL